MFTSNDHHINGAVRKRHAQTTVANIDILSRHTTQKNTPFLKSSFNLLRIYLKTDNVILRLVLSCTLTTIKPLIFKINFTKLLYLGILRNCVKLKYNEKILSYSSIVQFEFDDQIYFCFIHQITLFCIKYIKQTQAGCRKEYL